MRRFIATLTTAVVLGVFGYAAAEPGDGATQGAGTLGAAPDQGHVAKRARSPKKAFNKRDANADGKLTLDEFKGKKQGERADRATKRFKKLDTDGDGFIGFQEFKAGKT